MSEKYRCKHTVEAMRWTDTDENRERFAAWCTANGAKFEVRVQIAILADEYGEVAIEDGRWLVRVDSEFIVLDADIFAETYEPTEGGR